MFKTSLVKTKNPIHKSGFLVLISLFVYIAIMLTKLNNNLEIANKSISNLSRSNPSQNQNETISISEMMDTVNFRHEFDYIQNRLDDLQTEMNEINGTLGIVEINTR